jgi:phosphoglycerate dehydrogenase-like enzyme
MRISVLNGNFFDEQDIKQLREIGDDVKIYENTFTKKDAIERLKGTDIAVVDGVTTPLDAEVLKSADKLKLIAINSVDPDGIDMDTATIQGIQVANVPGYSTDAVAAHVFALLLAVSKKILSSDSAMRQHPFQIDPASKDDRKYLGFNPVGKTMGIIGLGQIGQRVAQIAKAMGMDVIAYNRSPRNIPGVKMVSLDQLLRESDVISLHLPTSKETKNIIDAEALLKMKQGAILINTGRGSTVDESALAVALQSGKLAGAGLDDIVDWSNNNPLLKMENVVLTPHSAFYTPEALKNSANQVIQNVKAFIEGKPTNIVNLWQRISYMNLWQNRTDKNQEKDAQKQKNEKPTQKKFDLTA